MKTSESVQKFLSSPIPVVLISFFLFFTQFMFLFELKSLSFISIFRIFCYSFVFGLLITITGKHRFLKFAFAGMLFFEEILILLIIIYVRYFHVIPTIFSLKLVSQAGDAAPSFSDLITYDLFSLIAGTLLSVILLIVIKPYKISKKCIKRYTAIIFALLLLPLILTFINKNFLKIGKNRAHFISACDRVEQFGYLSYLVYHFFEIQSNLDYSNHLKNPNPLRNKKGEHVSKPPYNFILIQIESLDDTLIGEKTKHGVPIIPVITKLAKNNLYFPNIYALHGSGGSSDAEFAVLTGLLPLKDHPVFLSHELNHLPSIVKDLKHYGYSAYGFHGNDGNFWNRKSAYKQLGFDNFYDSEYYSEWASGWKCLDGEFFKESIPYLEEISKKQPFFAYLITISMHSPYNITFITEHNKNIFDENYQNAFYFQRANYTDRELGLFLNKLQEKGILKNTVVMIFGDHTSGLKNNTYDCGKDISENIPLIIIHPDKRKGIIETFGSQTDIPPTILDIAGISGNKLMFGRTLTRRFSERLYPIIPATSNYIQTPIGIKSFKEIKNPVYNEVIQYSRSYFYKTKIDKTKKNPFHNNRFIAHALGSIDNINYTNSLEALNRSYEYGFRLMEVYLSLTKDKKLVCFHEGCEKDLNLKSPINQIQHETFISKKIHKKYTPLDFDSLLEIMEKYPDLYIVTDVKEKLETFIPYILKEIREKDSRLLDRIIPQIYFPEDLDMLLNHYEFPYIIFTLYKTSKDRLPDEQIIDFVKDNTQIKAVTASKMGFSMLISSELNKLNIPLYLHTVNKGEEIYKFQSYGVKGFYTDVNSDFLNPVIKKDFTYKPKDK